MIDVTHDPARKSWGTSANGHQDFPIQNGPLGALSTLADAPRGGCASGDAIFYIGAALEAALFCGQERDAAEAAAGSVLNPLLALPGTARQLLRRRVSEILSAESDARGLA